LDKSKLVAVLEATFTVIAWGASFIATKVALQDVSPASVVWLRFSMGVVILGAILLARGQWALPKPKEIGSYALLGFIGITFHQWLQSTGLVTAQASTTAWIVATTPVFIGLLGWLLLREKLGWIGIAGIVLAALGVLLVVSKGDLQALSTGNFGTSGDLLILISAPNWAVFSVLSRRLLQTSSPTRSMFYVMGFGWLFTSPLFFAGPGMADIARLTRDGWMGVGFLGIFCSGLAYFFWYDALSVLPASRAGAFLYLEPLVAVIVAAWLLSEPVYLASVLGGGVILLGVWLVNRPATLRERPVTRHSN
jgi:drug/metabolite transporter (DMT)-like permease